MWKIEVERDGCWGERDGQHQFVREQTAGDPRLRLTVPRSIPTLVLELSRSLVEPFQLLYVLHTSRGEGSLGRYQSPDLSRAELEAFLTGFSDFLVGDARHDLWLRSVGSAAMIVWDRHNDVYVYGELDAVIERLGALGFQEGPVAELGLHKHHYRAEFDDDARAVLGAFRWRRTALRPEDEQHVAPVANDS